MSDVALSQVSVAPDGLRAGSGRRHQQARAATAYADLSRQVQATGLMRRRLGWYWSRIAGTVLAFALAWVAFVVLGDSWTQLAVAAILAVAAAQFGFLGHDGLVDAQAQPAPRHAQPGGQGPRHRPGGACPHPGRPQARTERPGATGWFVRRQGWFFFPLLLLEGVNLHVAGLRALATGRHLRHRRLETALVVTRLGSYVAVVFLMLMTWSRRSSEACEANSQTRRGPK